MALNLPLNLNFNYRHVFAGLMAVLLLGFLFNEIRANNPKHAEGIFEIINDITVLNERLNADLWRYQIGVAGDYKDANQKIAQLKQLKSALTEGEYAIQDLNDAEMTTLFNEMDLALNAKERQIEDFFIANATLKKTINFTQRQIHELQQAGKAPPMLRQLDQELYYAGITPLIPGKSSLATLSEGGAKQLSENPATQQFFIEQILAQLNDIIAKNAALYTALDVATQRTQQPLTKAFDEGMHRYFDAKRQTSYYIQSFLFIISIVSIAYSSYLLVKLSGKEDALKNALSDIENLQYAFDQHAIISFSDASGNFTRVNEKFCTLSEYTEKELIGKNHWMMHSGDNSDAIYHDIMEKARSGQVWHGELQSKTHTGKVYWVFATIVPFVNSMQQLYQLISIRTDITLSKRLEAEITDSNIFIQKLTDTMTQGVYAIDRDGVCTFWNKQAEVLLGWMQRDIMMRKISEYVTYRDEDDQLIALDEQFFSDQAKTIEARVWRKSGTSFPVSVTVAPLTEKNKLVGFVVVFQDISELKEQQRLLHEAMQAAEMANQTKSAFLANMSHEIRTPMNGIIGMTDLALDTELTTEQREFLSIAKNSANNLLTIINDILDFSKIEAGKLELDAVEFDLYQVMREIIKNLSIRAYKKGLEMIIDTSPDVPRYLIGDSGRLGQVIINLIGNAIKFTEQGEIIVRVRLHSQKDQQFCLQFYVEDTGIGIPEESQKDVFSSFSQVDASVFRKYGGTGLGLSIAKQLVELMHGKIGVTSQVNKGTSFHFTAWFNAANHEYKRIVPLPSLSKMRVLLVEDNARLRNLTGHTLTSWGLQVLAVKSAGDALTLLRKEPDKAKTLQLMVFDEELPDNDGFWLAEQLQQEHLSDAPIIMLLSSIYSAGRNRKAGADIRCVISKPASQSDLLDAVHTVFGGPVANAPAGQDAVQHIKQLQPLQILLAEDNAINQQLAVRLLEKQGHSVQIANNGEECLAMLAVGQFDLILMDFQMPIMDGLQATKQLRSQGFTIPVIAMTANAMKGDRERAIDAGMNDYLTKPIKVTELFDVIGRYFPEVDAVATEAVPEAKVNAADKKAAEEEFSAAMSVGPICDWESALSLLGGDDEILIDMANMYVTNADGYVETIVTTLKQKQVEELTRSLHTLKGIFALFKATKPEQVLIKAEHDAHAGDFLAVAKVVGDIAQYSKALKAFLQDKLANRQ